MKELTEQRVREIFQEEMHKEKAREAQQHKWLQLNRPQPVESLLSTVEDTEIRVTKESYLERAARLEFELRETGICKKGCCSLETLEAERIMQEAIKKPIDGKNSKPLTRKRIEIK